MKPSLFQPAAISTDAAPASVEIPTGERTAEELIAELAIISRNHVASAHLIQMKLAALTYPEDFRRVLLQACSELGALVKLHEDGVALMEERHGRMAQREQQLADRIANLERRLQLVERQVEEPPDLAEAEDRGTMDIRGYRATKRRGTRF